MTDDGLAELRRIFTRQPDDDSTAVVEGYGAAIVVDRGQLVLRDGMCEVRRERRYPRAGRKLRRVVVLGHTGHISLDALLWCAEVGVSLAIIDTSGDVLLSSAPPARDDSRLRRTQATAAGTAVGLDVARGLVAGKLTEQAAVARSRLGAADVAAVLDDLAERTTTAADESEVRAWEAKGAGAYWSAWAGRALRFARQDARRVPDHWTAGFRGRLARPATAPLPLR